MTDVLATVLASIGIASGMTMLAYALYLEYTALPQERKSKRAALALGGSALILFGVWILS